MKTICLLIDLTSIHYFSKTILLLLVTISRSLFINKNWSTVLINSKVGGGGFKNTKLNVYREMHDGIIKYELIIKKNEQK